MQSRLLGRLGRALVSAHGAALKEEGDSLLGESLQAKQGVSLPIWSRSQLGGHIVGQLAGVQE